MADIIVEIDMAVDDLTSKCETANPALLPWNQRFV